MDRRTFIRLTAAGLAAAGCKKQRDAEVPQVWDDAPVPGQAEALAKLAPPWPAPARAVIGSGLLTFWLEEKASPAMHVRLMFPKAKPNSLAAPVVASAAEYLRFEIRRRLGRAGVEVDVEHRPGRVEIGLHGPDAALKPALRWSGWALSRRDPSGGLLAARQRLLKQTTKPTSEEVATAVLASRLLGLPPSSQFVDAAQVESVGRDALLEGFAGLTDPRRCVMVVHAGTAPADAADELSRLADTWEGKGRLRTPESILGRVRPKLTVHASTKNLMTDASAPLIVPGGPSSTGASLVLGRVIPTPDARERAIVRLAQRLMQEELDARLTMAGPHALLAVHVPLSGDEADERTKQAIAAMAELARTRHPQQRLFQAAQLWLGARVVQASLDGEDWTALWSESMDLAMKDGDIPRAMAVDATAMLAVQAEQLQAWQKKWFDPRAGAPGWQWVVAGADDTMLRRLSRLAPLETLQV
jgi:hypothetical protein